MRFLSPTDEKCAEWSTYWQFFYYRPPDEFRFTHLGETVKMLYIYIYVYIYDALDNRSGFSISVQPGIDCTTSHNSFSLNVWFFFFKSWQVCDRLAKWIIMLRFMALRWPRVFRRSNVGLVQHRDICVTSQWPVNKNWCKKTSKWNRIDIIFIIDSVFNFAQYNIHLCCHP